MNLLKGMSLCFDLDGTLVDTAPDLVRVLNEVITEQGLKKTEFEAARNQVGFGAKYLMTRAYERQGQTLEADLAEKLLGRFLDLYAGNIAELSTPFPGVVEALTDFKRQGAELSVCTNKPGFLARPLLEALDMNRFFDRVIGSRDGVLTKPNRDHIFAAVGHRDSSKIIMMGDSPPDVLAARQAAVPVIVFEYGYADMPSRALRADRVLRSFRDLPDAVTSIAERRFTRNSRSNW